MTEGKLFASDLGSSNGTKVNGSTIPAQSRVSIKDSDTITLGSDICLKFYSSPGFWEILQRQPSRLK